MSAQVKAAPIAGMAMIKFNDYANMEEALFQITTTFKGRITNLQWITQRNGLSENITYEFSDDTRLMIAKFIRPDGRCKITLKVTT